MSSQPQEPGKAVARVEVGHLTPEHRRTIDEAAELWKAEWTSLEKAKPDDLKTVARIIVQAFPSFGSLELLKYFYLLGGKIYDNAEFWMHQAAQHPDYRGCDLSQIFPDTPDWDELIGKNQDPAALLVAVKAVARRVEGGGGYPLRDKEGNEILRIETEASYVLATDSMLAEYSYQNLAATVRAKAEEEAKAFGPVDRVFWQGANPRAGSGEGRWVARLATPKPDAIALGLKKARSTASRRVLRRLFSLGEARITSTLAHVNQYLGATGVSGHSHRFGEFGEGKQRVPIQAGLNALIPENPETPIPDRTREYGEGEARATPRPPSRGADDAVGAGAAERFRQEQGLKAESHHDAAADRAGKLISEPDRRKLYTDIERKDFSRYADDGHDALHALIAEMKNIHPADPRASTKDLTYPEWEQLRHLIDALPPAPDPTAGNPPPFGKGAA